MSTSEKINITVTDKGKKPRKYKSGKTIRRPKPKNKPRNEVTRITKELGALTGLGKVGPNRFPFYRQLSVSDGVSALQKHNEFIRKQYLAGLIHPDLAQKNNWGIKLPSDMPIPTAPISFRIEHQVSTSDAGAFLLSWRPCFLITQEKMSADFWNGCSQMTFCNATGFQGLGPTGDTNKFLNPVWWPNISLQKYRLVSALLKVKYNGKVLDQAGRMIAAATFDDFGVGAAATVGNPPVYTDITELHDTSVNRFGTVSLIQNGLWNTVINVNETPSGIECLYVPMDPDDYCFQNIGTYYGNQLQGNSTMGSDYEGAHINYVVAGTNLPVSSNCIMIEVFYNYEVIADPSSAPLLRSQVDTTYTSKDRMDMANDLKQYGAEKGFISPGKPTEEKQSFFSKFMDTTFKYAPRVLDVMKMAAGIFA